MKKKSRTSPGSAHSKAMVAAAVITLPLAGLPSALNAQDRTTSSTTQIGTISPLQLELMVKLSVKEPLQATIMGLLGGRTVYTNSRGEYFYLESTTGDFHYLTKEEIATFTKSGTIMDKHRTSSVTILGLDASGNVIQRNTLGQTFYLNSRTGDMVFVK